MEVIMKNILLILALTIIIFNISCKKSPTSSSTNTAPVASFSITPTSGTVDTVFDFNATGSSDIEDATSVLEVRWDWENDGTWDTNFSTTKTATHQYATVGTHTIKLEVKDSGGMTNTTTKYLVVQQPSIVVTFPDANFEALIRETLNKSTGDIYDTDLVSITSLIGHDREIINISGIEYCTNLTRIILQRNQISDISVLSSLTNLTYLSIGTNPISDINALNNLTNLTYLNLYSVNLNDISVLSNLINLVELFLHNNIIIDINPLTNLVNLDLLYLQNNQIVDIVALVNNTGIGDSDELWLNGNPLSDTSINTYIPQLEARGVTIYY